MDDNYLNRCFSGELLYGDNFTLEQIASWFDDEKEGYSSLWASDRDSYQYVYHALDRRYGFPYLDNKRFRHALGIGSAYGDEFMPLAQRIDKVTILDPSDAYAGITDVHGIPCDYRKPDVSGTLPFTDSTFDLVVCLSAMHHIPNVSHVLRECFRCLEPGGQMLLREPVVSMGDWRKPRPGLTRHERGIPLPLFDSMIAATGFKVRHRAPFNFPPVTALAVKAGLTPYNQPIVTFIDSILSKIFLPNLRYHPEGAIQKLRPTGIYYVLEKPRNP